MFRNLCILVLLACLMLGCSNTSLKEFIPSNLLASTNPSDFLTDTTYKQVVIEVIQVEQAEPYTGDFDFLISHIKPLVKKPGGISYVIDKPIPLGEVASKTWTDDDALAFETKYAKLTSSADKLVVHLLFVHGVYYDSGETTNAAQIAPHTAVFFYDVYGRNAGQPPVIETHEFGHMLGLVNHGTPARYGHEDSDHSTHCSNIMCIMFWAASSLQSDFCPSCKSDLLNANK